MPRLIDSIATAPRPMSPVLAMNVSAPMSGPPAHEAIRNLLGRYCELLDAGLELATSPGQGTTFRVILPRAYH